MTIKRAKAMEITKIKPFINLTNPVRIYPSIISVNELISGTPGTVKSTEVAIAISGFIDGKNNSKVAEIKAAIKAPKKVAMYRLNEFLAKSCFVKSPAKVATNTTAKLI